MDFNKMSLPKKMEYFWGHRGELVDSLETLNFNYYLIRDKLSDMVFEFSEGRRVFTISVKTISESDILKRYAPGHQRVENNPWI